MAQTNTGDNFIYADYLTSKVQERRDLIEKKEKEREKVDLSIIEIYWEEIYSILKIKMEENLLSGQLEIDLNSISKIIRKFIDRDINNIENKCKKQSIPYMRRDIML